MEKDQNRVEVVAIPGGTGITLEELTGHSRELKVSMGVWALLGLSYANMAPTTAINGSISTALNSGGPIAVLWGWFAVSIISLAVAASLGEMCSAYPHAAGQAFWAYQFAPEKWKRCLSYWTVWSNICGGWALLAAGEYIFASGVLGLVVAYHPDYVQQPWHLVLLYLGMVFLFFLINVFLIKILDRMTITFAIINVSSVVATIIALAACAPVKATPKFVFTGFLNETGWSSKGFVFLLGLLQSSFTIIGYDASTHLCEEALDPGRLAPIAIVGGVSIVGIVGFCYIIALLFCIPDVDRVINTPTFVPTIQIFQDSFGLHGATAAYCFNLLILAFACIGIVCATSRAVWSMSRDGGFPLSFVFKRVNHRFQVPLNALVLQSVVPAILGLIYLGSETIFFAFFQLTTIGYLVSYFIPILLVFLRRDLLPPAYWRMPNALAKFCNIVALLYIPFICVLFCIPNYVPVTPSTMNYTSAISAVFAFIGTIGWYAEVRRNYKGPASALHIVEEIEA
ncbi:uncharacterized protein JCM6883_006568 [Sporobolomyces salmoneus]|uniref:uncharacterized protein n=1 Tax=Sporobolomyces salmoneus TaxID=183962 RepID=UPI00316F202D